MADTDFRVKNGLVTGSNNATFGTALTLASDGNVGIGTSTPSEKLSVTGNITATANITATNLIGTVQTATQGTINHNSLSNYVADQHVAHSSVSISAGNGLTGGGTIAANRTLSVLAGTGIASNNSGVHVTNVPSSVTFNNGGSGAASGSTFNGNSPITVSYNTLGAPSTTGTNASGTWGISITGGIESTTPSLGYSSSGSNIDLSGQGGPQVRGQGSGAAMMSFHRPGAYAINFGLGTDNQLRTGGWSRGGNHVILDSGNYNSYAPTLTGGNASGTWGINISGSAASLGGVAAAGYAQLTGATFTGDIITYRSYAPTTGVIFLGNSLSRYLYFDGSNYVMPGGELFVNGTQVVKNSGTWGIDISGTAATATNATNATNASNATLATKASTLSQSGGNGSAMTFFWSGQSGQPTWLWGGNDGVNHYVYNPANFSVAYAASASSAGSTSQALTFASDGTGAAATTTFNGGTARTISYNSIGAPSTTGTNASGTWSININGSSGSTTTATTATNVSGGTVSATTGSFSSDLSFNSGYGSAAVAYGCRSWIRFLTNFGTPSITASGNVTSITDNGTGAFTINFTTALVDANYGAVANYTETNSATGSGNDGQASCHTHATGSVRVFCARGDGSSVDPARCTVVVFR